MARTRGTVTQYYNKDNRRLPGWLGRLEPAPKKPSQKPPNKGRPRIPDRTQNCNVKIKRMRKPRHFRQVYFKISERVVRTMWVRRGTFHSPKNWNINLHFFLIFSKQDYLIYANL